MNFISLLSVLVVRKVQLCSEIVYAILEISYAESSYTKFVDNGVFYHMIKFEIFRIYG